jgi:pimeloyl-ACP methyl ester carboxylesterase
MAETHDIEWQDVDKPVSGLATDLEHEIRVQREAIPIVFVPGIMGSRLRRKGTDGTGNGPDGLPNLRWDPSSSSWMFNNYSGKDGAYRKSMLVGPLFSEDFLEVDNADPVADGFKGIMEDYTKFLKKVRDKDWELLNKLFVFPVYAVGYNWTDSSDNSGKKLADRIDEIIDEAKGIAGMCEMVIVVTHSMGGIVARSASELHGAQAKILGIVHGVQPVNGAPAAYWRIKAGFEGLGPTSRILGNAGPNVTPILGNIPGGLQLLPNKSHRTNNGQMQWLTVTEKGSTVLALPNADPYDEIYRVKAVVRPQAGEQPSTNQYWGLVDPDLLDPGGTSSAAAPSSNPLDASRAATVAGASDPWSQYLTLLQAAEDFHDQIGLKAHPHTLCLHGSGLSTADVIELRVDSNWVRSDPYPKRGFRGFFTNADGKDMQAVLQDPAGDGDKTVVASSAAALDAPKRPAPGDKKTKVEHQPAYLDGTVQTWAIEAIIAMVKMRYYEKRSAGAGNSP